MLKKIILTISFLCVSCKTTRVEKALEKCMNESLEYNSNKVDFINFILKIENSLIENNMLTGVTKNDYLGLSNEVYKKNKKVYSLVDSISFEYGFFIKENNLKILSCTNYVLITEKNKMNSTFFYQSEYLNSIFNEGYENHSLVNEYISSLPEEDFQKIIYRSQILLVLMNKLYNDFWW